MALDQLILLLGQSNCVGQDTDPSELTGDYADWGDELDNGVKICMQENVNSDSDVNGTSTDKPWHKVIAREGANGYFGPEIGIARSIPNVLTHAPSTTYIAKCATGSTNLAEDWAPDAATGRMCYPKAIRFILAQMAQVSTGYEVPAVFWIQGERDAANATHTAAYKANLHAFAAALRAEFGNPDMMFILSTLSTNAVIGANDDDLRTAQIEFVAEDSNAYLYNTDSLAMQVDNKHYTSDSIAALGEGLGGVLNENTAACG